MSVRRREWRDRHGRLRKAWMVDVVYRHADGTTTRVREPSPVQTRRAAEKREREIRTQLEAGTYRRKGAEVPTLTRFAAEFMANYAAKNNKPSVIAEKERIIKHHLKPALGRMRLDQITTKDVEAFKAQQDCAPKTLNNRLAVLSRMLTVAAEWGYLEEGKLPKVKQLAVAEPAIVVLDWEAEVPALLAEAIAYPLLRELVTLLLHTGLRIGEAKALQWGDIHNGRITVRRSVWYGKKGEPHIGTPKHGKTRTVPLNATAEAALSELSRSALWVFPGSDGELLKVAELSTPLATCCSRAGIAPITWHPMRHTFGTRLVSQGVPLPVVKDLMGHASIKTTMRYLHFAPAASNDAVRVLDDSAPAAHTRHVDRKAIKK